MLKGKWLSLCYVACKNSTTAFRIVSKCKNLWMIDYYWCIDVIRYFADDYDCSHLCLLSIKEAIAICSLNIAKSDHMFMNNFVTGIYTYLTELPIFKETMVLRQILENIDG